MYDLVVPFLLWFFVLYKTGAILAKRHNELGQALTVVLVCIFVTGLYQVCYSAAILTLNAPPPPDFVWRRLSVAVGVTLQAFVALPVLYLLCQKDNKNAD